MDSFETGNGFGFDAEETPKSMELAQDQLERYRQGLAEFELTDEQEAELLSILWDIMRTFVELGFSVDVCEQFFGEANLRSAGFEPDAKLPSSSNTETQSRKNGKDKP